MRPVVGSLLKLMIMGLAALAVVQAQAQDGPPPEFRTIPTPAPPDQPFNAVFSVYTFSSSFGIWNPPIIEISGNQLTVLFDHGCGFICPGGMSYREFPFLMPSLPAGTYTIAFVEGETGPTIAEFDFTVAVGAPEPHAAPGPGIWALMLLTLAIAATGVAVTGRRFRTNSPNGTDS